MCAAIVQNEDGEQVSDGIRLRPLEGLGDGRFTFCGYGQLRLKGRGAHFPVLQAAFVPLGRKSRLCYAPVPVSCLPLLPLGSTWQDGIHLETPGINAKFSIDFGKDDGSLPAGARMVLAENLKSSSYTRCFDVGCPLLSFPTDGSTEVIIPASEMLRAFYWLNSRVIRSVNGGLFNLGSLPSQAYEAWREGGLTGWIDHPAGIAAIQVGRNTSNDMARRIARFRFSKRGQRWITQLHKD